MLVLAVLLLAASPTEVQLDPGAQPKIQHTRLEKTPRGETVFVRAVIEQPSRLFAPLVFARPSGSLRFHAYTMVERTRGRGYVARLPASILDEGSFEYFIEARQDRDEATRLGSPAQPLLCVAYDRAPRPVPATVRTEQPGAEVRVDGDVVGTTPLTVPLGPGPHVIQISSPDGRSAEQQLDVKPGARRIEVVVPLRARAGGPPMLAVASDPPGGRVLVDGTLVGNTPYESEIAPGAHAVAVEMDGRRRQERQVTAREGRDLQLQFLLAALPNEPALTVESRPSGALVKVDGKDRGRTPFIGPLAAGPHQLVLGLAGRRDVATDFSMPADRDLLLRLDLPASSSAAPHLTVGSTPDGANLRVDGAEVGLTPWTGELPPGTHRLQLSRPGFASEERAVSLQPDRDAEVAFALVREAGPGKLTVETDPPGAAVAIDGQKVGASPYTGALAAGDHLLEVARDGYRTLAQQLSIEPAQQVSLRLALPRAGEGRGEPLVAVNSDPEGAEVFLDGKLVGRTRWKGPASPGKHEVVLALAGYKNGSVPFTVPEGRDFELRLGISLKRLREAETHSAPSSDDLARAQVRRGEACAKLHDWRCASEAYRAAYALKPIPPILWNVANAHRQLGQFGEAADAYRAYLKDAGAHPQLRKEAGKMLAYCDTARGRQALASATPRPAGAAETLPIPSGAGQAAAAADAARKEEAPLAVGPGSTTPSAAAGSTRTGEPAVAAVRPPTGDAAAAPLAIALPQDASASLAVALPQIDEDTTPPLLVHDPVPAADRGKTLRIAARIADERSGIGTAQLCWRNLYRPDYECLPLAARGDQYSAELPARAVTDGLAYYLEAYDAAGNGPVRSGAPDQPHAVATEDSGFPIREALTAAMNAGYSTEAPRTSSTERAAFQVRRQQPLRVAPPVDEETRPWRITAIGGAERSSEGETEAIVQSRFGIDASRVLAPGLLALARFDWRSARQSYVPDPGATPGVRIALDEQRYDLALGVGYDVGAALSGGDLSLMPTLGLQYLGIRNGTFPTDSIGPDVGGRARFHLVWRLDAQAAVAYSYNLASPQTHSALGTIQSHLASSAGLALPLGRFGLSLEYRNDLLAFTHAYRVAHGATFGIGSSF